MARLLAQTATFQNSSKLTSLARTAKKESEDSDNSGAESYDPRAELSDAIVLETVGTAGLSFSRGQCFLLDFFQRLLSVKHRRAQYFFKKTV